jgi:hypothetical protein
VSQSRSFSVALASWVRGGEPVNPARPAVRPMSALHEGLHVTPRTSGVFEPTPKNAPAQPPGRRRLALPVACSDDKLNEPSLFFLGFSGARSSAPVCRFAVRAGLHDDGRLAPVRGGEMG